MGAHSVFDNSLTLEYATVGFSDVALELMVSLGTVSGTSYCLPELHIIDQVEYMNTLEDCIVFKQCSFQPGVSSMGIEFANDIALSVWTSIGYYSKRIDERLFKSVAQLLKKKGLFLILNTMSQEHLLNHYCSSMFNETDRYMVLHQNNRFDRYHSVNTETWVFYEKNGRDLEYVDELELRLRIYSLAEIVEMAEAAGMEFVEAYDNLRDLSPARPDSVINVVLQKK